MGCINIMLKLLGTLHLHSHTHSFKRVVKTKVQELTLVLFTALVLIIMASTLMFAIEGGSANNETSADPVAILSEDEAALALCRSHDHFDSIGKLAVITWEKQQHSASSSR